MVVLSKQNSLAGSQIALFERGVDIERNTIEFLTDDQFSSQFRSARPPTILSHRHRRRAAIGKSSIDPGAQIPFVLGYVHLHPPADRAEYDRAARDQDGQADL